MLAKRVTVNINDYTSADTFDAEIDFKQFPFDPRSIRSVAVTIAMEDTGRLYEEGTNKPIRIKPTLENTVFVGFADEESITLDESARTVRLEGRDNTALLIDRKYVGGPISMELSIDQIIQRLLFELPETSLLRVDNRVPSVLPVLAKFFDTKDDFSGKKNPKRDESYWDLIQRIMAQAGLIAYIELDTLVITTPRILYGTENIKRFIYGRNIKNLNFKRKIGRRKNFNIAVRAMVLATKEILTAFIPRDATTAWSVETGIPLEEVKVPASVIDDKPKDQQELKAAPYMSFRLSNINDKDHLIKVGENIYEELSRQQIEGEFETADMATVETNGKGENGGEFDILKLRNGTPVSVWIDSKDIEDISQWANEASRELYLRARKIDPKAARFLSKTLGRMSASFYTKAVQFSLDGSGFRAKVEFVNFIEIQDPNVFTGAE